MSAIRMRYLIPASIITAGLTVACIILALVLFEQQSAMTQTLRENVTSRRAAVDLEESLADISTLLKANVDDVSSLHQRLAGHLNRLREVADNPEEREASEKLDAGLSEYLNAWEAIPPDSDPEHAAAVQQAIQILESQLLAPCQSFRLYNGKRIEQSALDHEDTLGKLAVSLTMIGILGGVAGVALGFGLTRALGRSIRQLQVQIRDAAGKLNSEQTEVLITEDGRFSGVHAQLDELTAGIETMLASLKQRELEVLRSEQLAAVGHLAAGVAHEIRNPLTSIKMLVQAGQEHQGQQPLSQDDLSVIEKEIRRMESSLKTFLNFARPPRLERKLVPVAPILKEVADLVRGRAEKQRVILSLDVVDSAVMASVDAEQIRQVLVNLVLNSLDAQPRGGAIELGLKSRSASPTGHIELSVTDTGPGISLEMLPRLFQPFSSSKETGVGLGLVISRRIIEDHGGTMTAENSVDGGAAFRVFLPS